MNSSACIRYHNNHTVKCSKPDCRNIILCLNKIVINSTNGEKNRYYKCILCGTVFRCCPNLHQSRYTRNVGNQASNIVRRITTYKKQIKDLESKLKLLSY